MRVLWTFFRASKRQPSGLCPACRTAKVSPEQHRRQAIHGFIIIFIGLLDGMYAPGPRATISITTEFPAYRLADLERVTRVLLTYFYLDCHKKGPSPLWVRRGLPISSPAAGTRQSLPASIARCSHPCPEETRLGMLTSFTSAGVPSSTC